MNRYIQLHLIRIFLLLFALRGSTAAEESVEPISIIPHPNTLERGAGSFRLLPTTQIIADAEAADTAAFLCERLRVATGYKLSVRTNTSLAENSGVIRFVAAATGEISGDESYRLLVQTNAVSISANSAAGWFYGVETLLQLFPPEVNSTRLVTNCAWQIPCVRLSDQPRFRWRGFMLDVSRHFFAKDEIKQVLDIMAMQKLNTFHWHLTDDHGWRIEIKKYPKLTEIGAWRSRSEITPPRESPDNLDRENAHPRWAAPAADAFRADGRYGGFYTQDDLREIVAYAAMRHITIVPEIEMPGHAIAALSAYPELSCDHGVYTTDANAGINKGVFCVCDDNVIRFLDDVLLEVFQLFPGKYIHIGGDEVNAAVKKATWGKCASCQSRMKSLGLKNEDQLQSWFIGQMEKFVRDHGKVLVGWSEIVEGGLAKNAVVMDWRGGAMEAATNGQDVVMSPSRFCYLDYYQSLDRAVEPHSIGGFLPLEKVYQFDPIPEKLAPAFQSHILGIQGNLWTEYVASLAHVEYMMLPRLCAIAEIGWSTKTNRDWSDFLRRSQTQERRFDLMEVNYHRDHSVKIGEWAPAQLTTNSTGTNIDWDVSSQITETGAYRIAFEFERGTGLTISSATLLVQGKEIASDTHPGFAGHRPNKPIYVLRVPDREAGAKCVLRAHVTGSNSSGRVWLSKAPGDQ